MSAPKDCSPAFPIVTDDDQKEHLTVEWGLTIRDYFAGQALIGLVSIPVPLTDEEVAEMAYKHADAMMKARQK